MNFIKKKNLSKLVQKVKHVSVSYGPLKSLFSAYFDDCGSQLIENPNFSSSKKELQQILKTATEKHLTGEK